jgi:hypothetical protein
MLWPISRPALSKLLFADWFAIVSVSGAAAPADRTRSAARGVGAAARGEHDARERDRRDRGDAASQGARGQ